jgi:tartrate-resistant acid phosphatase type 5
MKSLRSRRTVLAAAATLMLVMGCTPLASPTIQLPLDAAPSEMAASTSTMPVKGSPIGTADQLPSQQAAEASLTPTPTATGRLVEFEDQLAQVGFSIPLTIQHISSSSAWLYFELELPVAGEVFYWLEGTETSGVNSVEFEVGSGRHIVELDQLSPGKQYKVRVGLPMENGKFRSPGLNGEEWGITTLKTLAEKPEHLRVAVIGDSGFGETITFALAAQMASRQPDFVIHTGDVVYSIFENGTPLRAFQAKYFWPFQNVLLQAPVYAVPGNHEYYSDAMINGVPFYFHVFPPLGEYIMDGSWVGSGEGQRSWFAVRMMDYQFLFLDSQLFYAPGNLSGQTDWLQEQLAEHPGPTIGIYHIPTYTSGHYKADGIPIRRTWLTLFTEANTVLILSGHEHNYERLNVDGMDFIVSGGGSRHLYPLEVPFEGSRVFSSESHFVLLDLYKDHIEVEVFNEFGDLIDKADLTIED